MKLFDKFFGGKRGGEITPTTQTMQDDEFWIVIQTTLDKSDGEFEEQQKLLKQRLT